MTIATSIRILKKNTGMVILVGIAARFVTSARDMAIMAVIKRNKFEPAKITADMVIGVSIQPCPVSAMPSHKSLFDC